MTEQEKCGQGLLYDTAFPGREAAHIACAELCYDYNHTRPSDMAGRERLLRKIFGKLGENPYVEPMLFCGFGFNIEAGDNFFANNNCVFVDPGKITFGDDVKIAPPSAASTPPCTLWILSSARTIWKRPTPSLWATMSGSAAALRCCPA